MPTCRLILDDPTDGATNMAIDEALLASAGCVNKMGGAGQGSTLRFYGWREPTLSLGYFQRFEDRERHEGSRAAPVVRRVTGGGAILHDRELTYSFVTAVPSSDKAAARELYDAFHQTLIETLAEFGAAATLCCPAENANRRAEPFLCFQRRGCGDVLVRGEKVCGSAQRRRDDAVLQHGSVILARSPAAPEVNGLFEVSGVRLSPEKLAESWLPRLARRLGWQTELGELQPQEREFAAEIRQAQFAAAAWTRRK